MHRTKTLSDGTRVNMEVHGRPKGTRKKALPGGAFYYLEKDGRVYVYKTNGELETILGSVQQAQRYARDHSPGVATSDTEDYYGDH